QPLGTRGYVNFKLGQFDSAIADYDAALRIDPRRAASLYGRGLAKQKKGDVGGGNADIAAATAIRGDVADQFARYGEDVVAVAPAAPSATPPSASTGTDAPTGSVSSAEQLKSVASAGEFQHRVALVIGNSNYAVANPLRNPRNDAGDMAAALRKIGFDVVEG